MNNHEEHYPGIDKLAYAIRWLQELIAVLSVPMLTIGLIVGTYDFLSGGALLQTAWIRDGWFWSQSIAVDSCLAMYWVKTVSSKGWAAKLFSALLGVALAIVAGGVNYLQVMAELLHVTALNSLNSLGINPSSIVFARALLSVVLVAVGAISLSKREISNASTPVIQSSPVQRERLSFNLFTFIQVQWNQLFVQSNRPVQSNETLEQIEQASSNSPIVLESIEQPAVKQASFELSTEPTKQASFELVQESSPIQPSSVQSNRPIVQSSSPIVQSSSSESNRSESNKRDVAIAFIQSERSSGHEPTVEDIIQAVKCGRGTAFAAKKAASELVLSSSGK